MEQLNQKPRIALYAKRPFGEKMNATFDFVKENWKPILKYITYFLLPLCLIQALSMNGLMSGVLTLSLAGETGTNPLEGLTPMLITSYGVTVLCAMAGSVLLYSLVFSLIKLYNTREERLVGITFAELKPTLFTNIGRLLILMLFGIGVSIVVTGVLVLLTLFTPLTLFITIPLLLACGGPLMLLAPIYLFEEIGVWAAFTKTFRLGFATWGGTFLILLITSVIANILQGITMTPWYVATMVKYFFAISDTGGSATVSVGYSFMLYLLGIIQAFGAYLSMIFCLLGMAFQYGHASEVVDSVSVESDIDQFEKL